MSMHQVVSFSGGRTSAYLVHLMEAQRKAGASVHFIFMDTGTVITKDGPKVKKLHQTERMPVDDDGYTGSNAVFGVITHVINDARSEEFDDCPVI